MGELSNDLASLGRIVYQGLSRGITNGKSKDVLDVLDHIVSDASKPIKKLGMDIAIARKNIREYNGKHLSKPVKQIFQKRSVFGKAFRTATEGGGGIVLGLFGCGGSPVPYVYDSMQPRKDASVFDGTPTSDASTCKTNQLLEVGKDKQYTDFLAALKVLKPGGTIKMDEGTHLLKNIGTLTVPYCATIEGAGNSKTKIEFNYLQINQGSPNYMIRLLDKSTLSKLTVYFNFTYNGAPPQDFKPFRLNNGMAIIKDCTISGYSVYINNGANPLIESSTLEGIEIGTFKPTRPIVRNSKLHSLAYYDESRISGSQPSPTSNGKGEFTENLFYGASWKSMVLNFMDGASPKFRGNTFVNGLESMTASIKIDDNSSPDFGTLKERGGNAFNNKWVIPGSNGHLPGYWTGTMMSSSSQMINVAGNCWDDYTVKEMKENPDPYNVKTTIHALSGSFDYRGFESLDKCKVINP